jgi:hypothetical protein
VLQIISVSAVLFSKPLVFKLESVRTTIRKLYKNRVLGAPARLTAAPEEIRPMKNLVLADGELPLLTLLVGTELFG